VGRILLSTTALAFAMSPVIGPAQESGPYKPLKRARVWRGRRLALYLLGFGRQASLHPAAGIGGGGDGHAACGGHHSDAPLYL
jgi:hypothetical protein